MVARAADPTIRRQVMSAARQALDDNPTTSVGRIALRAGISRATFYRHFGSREALLASIEHAPRPDARRRILFAAQEMLLHTSLVALGMDELARAADVSRGTLYRVFPGKAALLEGLIEEYSPFEQIRAVVLEHADEPPETVLPLVARAVVGVAGERLGLLRAIFLEVTSGSEAALVAMRPVFNATLGMLAEYLASQMAAGQVRPMHPLLALQAFIGPMFFHMLTRPTLERMAELPMDAAAAVDQLVAVALAGLQPTGGRSAA